MSFKFNFSWFLLIIIVNCHSSAQITAYTGDEGLPNGLDALIELYHLYGSEDLYGSHGAELVKMADGSNLDENYLPEKRPKYPLPYYLIPEEDANFLKANSLDRQIELELSTDEDGRKFYRLFVHPNSEEYYSHLKELGIRYVDANQTEYMATPTSSHRSLIVWQPKDLNKPIFIAKLSLNRNSGTENRVLHWTEIERSVANQRALDILGKESIQEKGWGYFPETAGLNLGSRLKGQNEFLGGQIIREVPREILTGLEKWVPFGAAMSVRQGRPLLIGIIEKSGLDPVEFVREVLIYDFMEAIEKVVFEEGFNITTHGQNAGFILDDRSKYTGKFSFQDFGGKRPHILQMIRSGKGLQEAYRDNDFETKYRFSAGAKEFHGTNFITQYKEWVFRKFVYETLPSYFPEFQEESVRVGLMIELKRAHQVLMTRHRALPTLSIESDQRGGSDQTILDSLWAAIYIDYRKAVSVPFITETTSGSEFPSGKAWRDFKNERGERTAFGSRSGTRVYYATADGIYVVDGEAIVAFYFFNQYEKELYAELGPERIKEFYIRAVHQDDNVEDHKESLRIFVEENFSGAIVVNGNSAAIKGVVSRVYLAGKEQSKEMVTPVVESLIRFVSEEANFSYKKEGEIYASFHALRDIQTHKEFIESLSRLYSQAHGIGTDRWGTLSAPLQRYLLANRDKMSVDEFYRLGRDAARGIKNFIINQTEFGRKRKDEVLKNIEAYVSLLSPSERFSNLVFLVNQFNFTWMTSEQIFFKTIKKVSKTFSRSQQIILLRPFVGPLKNFYFEQTGRGQSRSGEAVQVLRELANIMPQSEIQKDIELVSEMNRHEILFSVSAPNLCEAFFD